MMKEAVNIGAVTDIDNDVERVQDCHCSAVTT